MNMGKEKVPHFEGTATDSLGQSRRGSEVGEEDNGRLATTNWRIREGYVKGLGLWIEGVKYGKVPSSGSPDQ